MSAIRFSQQFPRLSPRTDLVIYDRKLERLSPSFRRWVRKLPLRYGVQAGERLKDLEAFSMHAKRLSALVEKVSPRELNVVAVGGGSVGDFAGFFASVYKRGVNLIQVPSTWLAAIDSSHGGKTALNLGGVKNQVGTFYPAAQIILVRELLRTQSERQVQDAFGELAKIALIDGGPWVQRMRRTPLRGEALLWRFLRDAIEAKWKIVRRDPFEKTGQRQILNLGHTFGHVLEAKYGWSHGRSVAQGLFFALEFSERLGHLSELETERAFQFLAEIFGLEPLRPRRPLSQKEALKLLQRDKKVSGNGVVTFIFLERMGRPQRHDVTLAALVQEARRQGWVR